MVKNAVLAYYNRLIISNGPVENSFKVTTEQHDFSLYILPYCGVWAVYDTEDEVADLFEETGDLWACIEWCENDYKEAFVAEFPRENTLYKPLFTHDMLHTAFYRVTVDKHPLKNLWEYTVYELTDKRLFRRIGFKSYDGAVEDFARWLWDSSGMRVTAQHMEHYINMLSVWTPAAKDIAFLGTAKKFGLPTLWDWMHENG